MGERVRNEAADRAHGAWEQRYRHGKAARTWDAVAQEQPERREICRILARYMAAYEAADAEAERALRDLASPAPSEGAGETDFSRRGAGANATREGGAMSLTPNMEMNCSKAELAAKVVKSDTGQAIRDVVSSLRWHADELAKLRAELEEAKRLHEHVNDLLANEIELGGRTAEELGREREARKRAEAERLQALTDMHHACDRADRAEACALSVEVLEQLADMCEHASVHCVDDDDSAVATELLVNVKASLSAARSGGLGEQRNEKP